MGRNLRNEEKLLKRYLKKTVSLNVETMVKFLITGTLAVSLTACGGGGGGGSSSGGSGVKPPVVPPVVEEVVNNKDKTHEVTNSNSVITGTINGTKDNFTGLKAVNSTVENKATISLTGDGSIGIHGTADAASFTTRANHIVTNSGTISMSGHESVGMLVEKGVNGVNNGDINLESFESDEYITTEEIDEGIYVSQHTRKKMDFLIGMAAKNQGTILNEKNIKLLGSGIGMLASNESKAINNGVISLESKEQFCDVYESSLESDFEDTWQETHLTEVIGMAGTEKSEITNGKNGVISLNGEGAGMIALENSLANNDGQILGVMKLEEIIDEDFPSLNFSEIKGMVASKESIAINNGIISLEGGLVYGMVAEGNSTIINNGTIDLKLTDEHEIYEAISEGMLLENSSGENNGLITINGNELTHSYSMGVNITGGSFVNTESGKIEMEVLGEDTNVTGIFADNYDYPNIDINIVNEGSIKIAGDDATGISGYGINSVINNGAINVEGKYAEGISLDNWDNSELESNIVNKGSIKIVGDNATGIGGYGINSVINNGAINVEGKYAEGISLHNWGDSGFESNIINNGTIKIAGNNTAKYITGINSQGVSSVINNKEIIVTKDKTGYENENEVTGIYASGKSSYDPSTGTTTYEKVTVENNGTINVIGSDSDMTFGMEVNRGEIKNNKEGTIIVTADSSAVGISTDWSSSVLNEGNIIVNSDRSMGISSYLDSSSSGGGEVINTGKIEVEGRESKGISISGTGSKATNLGTINIDGVGSYGMYASDGATVTNGVTGVINVGASAAGGMYAGSGSTAINNGTINIHKDNEGGESIALVGSGELINKGFVTSDTDLTINTINGGAYVIGTSEDGSYGKISAKNVSIDGDVKVSANITKNGFKNEYTMQNVIDAEDITYGENFSFISTSVLYDAEAVTDRWGNLDGKLVRNDSTLSDYTSGYLKSVSDIFGKYMTETGLKELSKDAQSVIKEINTESAETIAEDMKSVTPSIYANLGRQMYEISETFSDYDMRTIYSLGENKFNFNLIGKYSDVDSRSDIEGYKSTLTGFVGAMDFGSDIYGTIGYGYSNIDYEGSNEGHIQSVHLGLNKLAEVNGFNLRFGLSGEYNFHENDRDTGLLSRTAKSDFDSYWIGLNGEISKQYGEEVYLMPYASLELGYGKHDSFTESDAGALNAEMSSQDYTSVLPKAGIKIGKEFGTINLYASADYSYELGNMDKAQEFSFEGFEGNAKLQKDSLESGLTTLKTGFEMAAGPLTLNANVGKEFGKRDRVFADLGIGYRF